MLLGTVGNQGASLICGRAASKILGAVKAVAHGLGALGTIHVLAAVITVLLQDSVSPGRTGRHWDRYERGSADAARSRASDPAAARAEPAAVLGLRRCTARAARRT